MSLTQAAGDASFEFVAAPRIIFGWGQISALPEITASFGRRALVVTGRNADRAQPLHERLLASGVATVPFSVPGEPTVALVRESVRVARANEVEMIVAIGGGSTIDLAKATAALVLNSGEPLDYLEVVGRGAALEEDALPWIAVPTTAGTGAEVTRNAVLGSPEHGIKASLRSPRLLPKVALIDPQLTLHLPRAVTVHSGLDALTQLIEPYVSVRANPLTDAFCKQGLAGVPAALLELATDPSSRSAREAMSYGSLLSGLALSNAGLGVVHGIAGPLGGMLDAPHGAICAALLPFGMEANVAALRQRASTKVALHRYAEIAALLTGDARAEPEHGFDWVAALCRRLGVASLVELGFQKTHIAELVTRAQRASSMKTNPIVLFAAELTALIERAC